MEENDKVALALQLVNTARGAVEMKAKVMEKHIKRIVSHSVHVRLNNKVQKELQLALEPLFKKQIAGIVHKLNQLGDTKNQETTSKITRKKSSSGRGLGLIEVPDIRQHDHFSCGAAAAMSVGKYFGVGPETLEEWKKALGTDVEESTRPQSIIDYFSSLGLHVEAKSNLTLDDLEKYHRWGMPVITPVQDYGPYVPAKAKFAYGHYLTVIGVGYGYVFCQDSSEDNVISSSGSIQKPGRVMIDQDYFMNLWHDKDIDGKEYLQFGIAVSGNPVQKSVKGDTPGHEFHGNQWTNGGGEEYVSPNVEHLKMDAALEGLHSERQKKLQEHFDKIDDLFGIKTKTNACVGAWADGAENTTMSIFPKGTDKETIQMAAVMKGFIADQKAILWFVPGKGNDVMVSMTTKEKDFKKLNTELLAKGIQNHTLVPNGTKGTIIKVFCKSGEPSNPEVLTGIKQFSEEKNVKFKTTGGEGGFIGSWKDDDTEGRAEGREIYEQHIAAYAGNGDGDSRGRRIAEFRRLDDNWRASYVKEFQGRLVKSIDQQAASIIKQVFDSKEWKKELVNRALPVLAVGMAKAMVGQLLVLGVDVRGKGKKKTKKSFEKSLYKKSSTATDWLEDNPDDLDELDDLVAEADVDGMDILTELPQGMKIRIANALKKSFNQDYWDNISDTTGGDAEKVLRQGLKDGWSIRDMAELLKEDLGNDDYARWRAFNIARTESCGALNSARKGVMDQLSDDLGDEVPMTQTWLSVLGPTTRETHADLDGVPEDEDGNWNLAGYDIPYPGHYSLPPELRCNCMCSLGLEMGMDSDESQPILQDYYDRLAAKEQEQEDDFEGEAAYEPSELGKDWLVKDGIHYWKYDSSIFAKGDTPGHEFHGNQWGSGGSGGGNDDENNIVQLDLFDDPPPKDIRILEKMKDKAIKSCDSIISKAIENGEEIDVSEEWGDLDEDAQSEVQNQWENNNFSEKVSSIEDDMREEISDKADDDLRQDESFARDCFVDFANAHGIDFEDKGALVDIRNGGDSLDIDFEQIKFADEPKDSLDADKLSNEEWDKLVEHREERWNSELKKDWENYYESQFEDKLGM